MESKKGRFYIITERMRKKVMKKILLGLLLGVAALSLAGCGNNISLLSDTFTYELGESISADAGNFVEGSQSALENTVITIDGLKNIGMASGDASGNASGNASGEPSQAAYYASEVGTYQATATIDDKVLEFSIIIEDTVAPEVELTGATVYVEPNKVYPVEYLMKTLSELSEGLTIELASNTCEAGEESDSNSSLYFSYSDIGEYDNEITVTDASGNETIVPVHIVVANAPTLEGTEDIYASIGDTIDYMDGVSSTDETDGDLTAQVSVDSSAVDTSKEGDYTATYSVTNSIGFTVTKTVNVYVMGAEVLQEKVASGTVVSSNGKITTTTDESGKQTVSNAHSDSGTTDSGSSDAGTTGDSSTQTTTTIPEKLLSRSESDTLADIVASLACGEISDSEAISQASAAIPRYSWSVGHDKGIISSQKVTSSSLTNVETGITVFLCGN